LLVFEIQLAEKEVIGPKMLLKPFVCKEGGTSLPRTLISVPVAVPLGSRPFSEIVSNVRGNFDLKFMDNFFFLNERRAAAKMAIRRKDMEERRLTLLFLLENVLSLDVDQAHLTIKHLAASETPTSWRDDIDVPCLLWKYSKRKGGEQGPEVETSKKRGVTHVRGEWGVDRGRLRVMR
jgi:hypothetical protein